MKELLRARFGKLPAEAPALQKVAPPEKAAASRLLLVDKPDSTQSFFALGNVGLAIDDPDRLAANLVNTLFGGRFTSRLNTALRIDSGLSYGASSRFTPNHYPGQFTILSFTKNESTGEALDAALKVLNELHQSGLTTAELDSGKAYMKGQFGPTLETSAQLAARLALFEIYGLDPKEEVDHYAARLDAITLADVRRVIEKLFPSTNLVFTVIGKAETIAPVVKKYAPGMRTISIREPGFGGQKD
jgi:predicted Zn-dependent peptidase